MATTAKWSRWCRDLSSAFTRLLKTANAATLQGTTSDPAEFVAEFVDRLSVCRRKDGTTPESYRRYVEWCGTMAAEAWRDWSTKNVRPEGGEYLDCGTDPLMKPKRRPRPTKIYGRSNNSIHFVLQSPILLASRIISLPPHRVSRGQVSRWIGDWPAETVALPRRTADHNSARLEMPSRRPEDPLPRGL